MTTTTEAVTNPENDVRRLLLFSADGHAGPPTEDFRPYLEQAYLDAFDEFLTTCRKTWQIEGNEYYDGALIRGFLDDPVVEARIETLRDPNQRLATLEADGVVGDVVFVDAEFGNEPPFCGIGGHDFAGRREMVTPELARAGARAYNRWLAEYCSVAPHRLLGIALLNSLHDVGAACREVRAAKEAGIHGGVFLPLHYDGLPLYNDKRYEPLWATCADVGLPVHTHAGGGIPQYGTQPEAPALYGQEVSWFAHRPLWFLVLAGVLERHPDLKLVFTEQGATWVIDALAGMDATWESGVFKDLRGRVPRRPSEYWHEQCFVGSILNRAETAAREAIGVRTMMWGSDFPHFEGIWRDLQGSIRDAVAGLPEADARAILGENAVRAYGLDVAALQPVVDRVGPSVNQIIADPSS